MFFLRGDLQISFRSQGAVRDEDDFVGCDDHDTDEVVLAGNDVRVAREERLGLFVGEETNSKAP